MFIELILPWSIHNDAGKYSEQLINTTNSNRLYENKKKGNKGQLQPLM